MGLLRFLLAASVVLFHLGGWGMLTGRLAVMGFYVASGFLIVRVLDRGYAGFTGKLAFVANRALRLFPLFAFLSIVSLLCFKYLGKVPVDATNPGELWLPNRPSLDGLNLLPRPSLMQGTFPILLGGGNILSQSWSIGVELAFYGIALVAACIRLRTVMLAATVASFAYFVVCFYGMSDFRAGYENGIYKDALTTTWMFGLGGAIYLWRKSRPAAAHASAFYLSLLLVVLLMLGLLSNALYGNHIENNFRGWKILLFLSIVTTVGAVGLVLRYMPDDESRWSKALGELSYGIYLNHFLTAWLLMYAGGVVGLSVFGRINTPGFAVVALYVSTAFAWLTYRGVEQPLSAVRRRIRTTGSGLPDVRLPTGRVERGSS